MKSNDFMQTVFDFIESITVTKQNLMKTDDDVARYSKCRWVLLRALSFSPDLVNTVNLINTMQDLSPRMEYEFLLNSVPSKMRRPKWIKKSPESLYMEAVQQYYGYNATKAVQAMKMLTVEQLTMIDKKIRKEDDTWETYSGGSG